MKQMIAVALCVPAFIFIEKRKPLVFLSVVTASAILFHQTAVVALFIGQLFNQFVRLVVRLPSLEKLRGSLFF